MFIYLFFFLFIVVISLCFSYVKSWYRIGQMGVILIIAIFAGIRSYVGADFENYKIIFEQIESYSATSFAIEPGFFLLNSGVVKIGGGFNLLLFICSCVSLFLVFSSIKYFCSTKNSWIAYVAIISSTYYLVYVLSGIRQGIAISIFLYSIRYIVEKKFLKYFISISCGMLFHYSIIVTLPFFFISRYKLKLKWSIILILFALIAMQTGISSNLFQFIVAFFTGHYSVYAELYSSFANSQTSLGIYLRIFSWILILCIAYKNIKGSADIVLYNLFVYGVLLYLCFLSVDIMVRISDYFLAVIILLLPQTLSAFKIVTNRYVYITYILFFLFLIYYKTIVFDSAGLFPYNTFFS